MRRPCSWARLGALLAVGVLAGSGCHALVGDEDLGGGIDGAPGTDGAPLPPDAVPIDGPNELGPWTAVATIPALATGTLGEDDLAVRFDELELIFAGKASAVSKALYVSTRATITDAWSAPTLLTAINDASTATSDQTPRYTPDGLTLYIGSSRTGTAGSDDVWVSTRATLGGAWSTPTRVSNVQSVNSDRWYGTCLAGTRFAMISNRGGASLDLYEGAVGAVPELIDDLSTAQDDLSPLISEDCLEMYFASDSSGDYELYRASRAAVGPAWINQGVVTGTSTTSDEQDPWLSADGHRLYFASNRDGEYDVYLATR